MPPDAAPHPVTPQASTTPLISTVQRDEDDASHPDAPADEADSKTGKRRFFGLGKKKEVKKDTAMATSSTTATVASPAADTPAPAASSSTATTATTLNPRQAPRPIPIGSPRQQAGSAANVAASPSRLRSGSPRMHSPASSEIFERSVQEPVQMSALQDGHTEAHMATHVITEDHIPPALEASAQAITSEELNPDEVEIVMSASHQPAVSVLEGSSSHADLTQLHSPMVPLSQVTSQDSEPSMHHSGMLHSHDEDPTASSYGQLDPNDVRRLSFISFADVVQSEHHQPPGSALNEANNRDSLHIASLSGSLQAEGRAASPLRTPFSPSSFQSRNMSPGVATPPPGEAMGPGSPVSPPSELTIETMRQAVRKTASGDLSGSGRSAGMSPVSDELVSAPRSRTNS